MAPPQYQDFQLPAFIWSAVMHGILFLLVLVGLPEIWKEHRESLPVAMSVEVVNISDITNIKTQESQKKEKTQKEQIAKAKKAVSESASNQAKKEEKKKQIAPPVKKEKPKPKKEKKPEKKPEPKKEKKKEKKSDLDSILKSVEAAAKKEQGDEPQKSNKEQKRAKADSYNPSLPMSMTEVDAIRSQFVQCWNLPAGARNAHELKVVIDVRLRADGSVISAELAKDKGRYYQDPFFRAAADSAVRAVYRCSPLKNLPPGKYETWKFIQMNFDPRDMLY